MSASKRKSAIPLDSVRRYLEPGPVLLVSSAHGGERDVMVMGWHTVMDFSPSLVGCVISSANHSFGLIRASGECVLNLISSCGKWWRRAPWPVRVIPKPCITRGMGYSCSPVRSCGAAVPA